MNVLYALSDSDFAGCKDTFRSTSGYMILMNGGCGILFWPMAETIALAKLVGKLEYMRALLFDLQCRQQQETMINSTCVWVKHVVRVRFLQECVQRKITMISYIKTNENIADIMTKQSAGPQLVQHRNYALGKIDIFQQCVAAAAVILRPDPHLCLG